MPGRELWNTPAIVPVLAYDDLPAAVAWLARAFGLRERPGSRLAWQGGGMTWLELDDGLIKVVSAGQHGLQSPRALQGCSQTLKVYVADVDRHFAQAQAAGAEIVMPPQDGFWGGRIYRAADPEGHRWEFAQSGRDLAVEHWQLPPGVTRQ